MTTARYIAIACILVAAAFIYGTRPAHGEEPETERYVPASRGPRASYDTPQVQRWREMVAAAGDWPVEQTLLVIACESEGKEDAENPSGATGLLQLLGEEKRDLAQRLFGTRNLKIAWVNLATAYQYWRDTGSFLPHWLSSKGCWS